MASEFEPAPLREVFWLGDRINPHWERWFTNTLNPVVETIVEGGAVIASLPTGPALDSKGDLLKRIENLETLLYASPQQGEDLSKRIEGLESVIHLMPLPRFYPVVDYDANPTVTSLRDALVTLGLMAGTGDTGDDDGAITWEDEGITWEDEGITHEDT